MSDFGILADKLLKKFGFLATIKNYSTSSFNIEEGSSIKVVEQSENINCVFVGIENGEIKEQSYIQNSGDKKILFYCTNAFNLNTKTELFINGILYNIIFIEEVKQKLNTVLYKTIIRQSKGK